MGRNCLDAGEFLRGHDRAMHTVWRVWSCSRAWEVLKRGECDQSCAPEHPHWLWWGPGLAAAGVRAGGDRLSLGPSVGPGSRATFFFFPFISKEMFQPLCAAHHLVPLSLGTWAPP